jgi:hypothetical protein
MGSIEKILSSLNKISEDKKSQISSRFDEESQWLFNELDLIKKLILRNQRVVCNHEAEKGAFAINSVNANAEQGQKRKSPEVAENDFRFSPVLKKPMPQSSIVPDFNKLRKDQLLEELDKLGIKNFTMKALKKDLVDALQEAYTKRDIKVESSVATKLSLSVESTSADQSVEQKSVRKNSLLDEIRVLVASTDNNVADPVEDKQRTEQEFEARQKRHRDSQIRLSQGTIPVQNAEEVVVNSASEEMPAQKNDDENQMSASPQKSITASEEEGPQSPMANTSWMDVASPQNVSKSADSAAAVIIDDEVDETEVASQEPFKVESISTNRPFTEADNTSISSTESSSSNTNLAPAVAKPTNIVMTSFLDKPQPQKPYVVS